MIKKLLRKLDATLDRKWRETCAIIFYYFDSRKDEVDIDWLNMHNDMIQKKGDRNE